MDSDRRSFNKIQPVNHTVEYVEISIPIPFGHIAAKWWGRQDVRPIVCLHGWQDNCGSFDTLIPLLPQHVGYLAIDFPGHGLSSFFPDGILYDQFQYVRLLDYVFRQHFKWPKVSLIGHSMSGILSFVLASLFPDYVDMVVSFDVLKPRELTEQAAREVITRYNTVILKTDINNMAGIEPPSYTYEELIDKTVEATKGSVNRESAPYLLQRGSKQSKYNPDRYYFSRDNRTKAIKRILVTPEVNIMLAKRIRCPYLFFRAEISNYSEDPLHLTEVMEALQLSNPLFDVVGVESTHHMQLVDPEKVSKRIEQFIHQYRPCDDTIVAQSKL